MNDGGRSGITRSDDELTAVMKKTIRRHPERMRRICTHGGENGKMLFNIKKPLPLQETVFCFQSGQVIAAILSIA